MNTLTFEKISQFDRPTEPVTVSIPFAQGALNDPRCLVIRDGDTALPSQRRALAHWEDGSVKWLLVHLQPDLPGNADKTLTFAGFTLRCDRREVTAELLAELGEESE